MGMEGWAKANKRWPVPVRVAFAVVFVTLVLLITFGPITLLLLTGDELGSILPPAAEVFGGYSGIVTVGTTAVVAIFAFTKIRKKPIDHPLFYIVAGSFVGLAVSLALIPITLGTSLFFGPPTGSVILFVGWLLRMRVPDL